MWLGILLIITRLFTTNQWSSLWSVFSDASSVVSKTTPAVKPGVTIVSSHKPAPPKVQVV